MRIDNNMQKKSFGINVFYKNIAGDMPNYTAGQKARVSGLISKEATQITPIKHKDGWFVIDDTTVVGRMITKLLDVCTDHGLPKFHNNEDESAKLKAVLHDAIDDAIQHHGETITKIGSLICCRSGKFAR